MKQGLIYIKSKIDKLFINAKNEDIQDEYTQLVVNCITKSELSVSEQSSVLIQSIEELSAIRQAEIEKTSAKLDELNRDYAKLVAYNDVARRLLT